MPRPRDVPRSGPRRSIAATSSARSAVGVCVEKPVSLKTTVPMRTELGWPSMNASAAVLAASIRVGATSVAAMLPETSNARMTVPSRRGTPMTLCGRASEKTRIVMPRTVRAAGMRRVHGRGRGADGDVSPAPPQPNRATRSARRRSRDVYSSTPTGTARRSSRSGGQMNDTGYRFDRFRRAAIRTIAPTRSSSVASANASTPARRNAAASSASRASRAASNRRRNFGSCVSM